MKRYGPYLVRYFCPCGYSIPIGLKDCGHICPECARPKADFVARSVRKVTEGPFWSRRASYENAPPREAAPLPPKPPMPSPPPPVPTFGQLCSGYAAMMRRSRPPTFEEAREHLRMLERFAEDRAGR